MALAAVLSAALNTAGAHPYSLQVGGLDVVRDPGAGGNRYGTPVGTISIEEQGPGYVSGLTFTYEDPTGQTRIVPPVRVLWWDHVRDVPLFHGWATTAPVAPMAGGVGITQRVQCVGIEAVLDWATVPAVTFPAGTVSFDMVQSLVGQASLNGTPLNVAFQFGGGTGGRYLGNQATPVGDWAGITSPSGGMTTPAGSLRQALRYVMDNGRAGMGDLAQAELMLTVDFYGGLRCWYQRPATTSDMPDDYTALTVSDTYASATVASGLEHVLDAGGVLRTVRVIGGNAAGTGIVTDGTGLPGVGTVVSDSTILTYAAMLARGRAELSAQTQAVRGSFALEDYTPSGNVRPGSQLVLTDATTGATGSYRISSIAKRVLANGHQEWTVTYGAPAPSYIDVRR